MGLYQERTNFATKRLACTLLVAGSNLGRAIVDLIETSHVCPASPHADIELTSFTGNRCFLPTVANVKAKQSQVDTNLK
jgi:hypothetical protein